MNMSCSRLAQLFATIVCCSLSAPFHAFDQPDASSPLVTKQFRHPDLDVSNPHQRLGELPVRAVARARKDLRALGILEEHARLDRRTGRWGTLLFSRPILPGDGVGNTLAWSKLGLEAPRDEAQLEQAAWSTYRAFLAAHAAQLRIDLHELSPEPNVVASAGGEIVQIYAPREFKGVRVRDSALLAVINHGNLVLFGAQNWGDVAVPTVPTLSLEAAREKLRAHLEPFRASGEWAAPELVLVPMVRGRDLSAVPVGRGFDYRLVWALHPEFEGELGSSEALVDAHGGELLAFQDIAHYSCHAPNRRVMGGVQPGTNDGAPPSGPVEQAGWPMPFIQPTSAGAIITTDGGGNLPDDVVGPLNFSLDGQYVRITSSCGPISLSSEGDIDFGSSVGTNLPNCTTPGIGGTGNTRASRTAFYELNRVKEIARGHLPSNAWLQEQLEVVTNASLTCYASFVNGTFVRVGTSGSDRPGRSCSNPGEFAGMYDHEFAHGLDLNDANQTTSQPSEGTADLYAALMQDNSCIAPNFWSVNCDGWGDPCTSCMGMREIDWAKRKSGQPHDVAWVRDHCHTGPDPEEGLLSGGEAYCRGQVNTEAVWDLYTRDLAGCPYNMDSNTAHELTNHLTFLGTGMVGYWFQDIVPYGGCDADSGYLNYLTVDDDNGDLTDGTPHMRAIFAAFDRHGAACDKPAAKDSGCAGPPTAAPVVTATAGDKIVALSWTPVDKAVQYSVFRTDSVLPCNSGKTKVATVSGTSFMDSGLQNGRAYSYVVIPKAAADSCFGPSSACTTATPVCE
jgi:hypothetical protein